MTKAAVIGQQRLAITLTDEPPALPLIPALLLFFLLTLLGAAWARWLGSGVLDFAPVWPPAGLAIAAALVRPALLPAVAAGLFCWGWLVKDQSIPFALANGLTLIGPILYAVVRSLQREDRRQTLRVKDLFRRYGQVLLWSVLPSSIVGTFLYAETYAVKPITDTLLVYLISETAGIAIFGPLASVLLGSRSHWQTLSTPFSLANIGLVLGITLLPLAFDAAGQSEYAEGMFLLMFPLIGWIALQNRRELMAVSMALLATLQLMMEMGGVGIDGSSAIFEFVERVIWLLAAFVLGNALLSVSLERRATLEQARWQATHNESTGWLNERGLQEQIATIPGNGHDLILAQVCGRDLLMASLSYTELRATERELSASLTALHDWEVRARLSDLTFGFLVPSSRPLVLDSPALQSLTLTTMDITVRLAWSRVPVDRDAPDRALVEGYAGLHQALEQPMNRVRVRTRSDPALAAQESTFSHYQRVITALQGGRLRLWGQPIQASDARPPNVELLARIEQSPGELIRPDVFLGALSAFDELEALDRAVITEAVRPAGPIRTLLPHFARININLSGSTLCDPGFVAWLDGIWPPDLPHERICFELTESELIRNPTVARQVFSALRARGFKLAIDDFGSGLASFEYLEHFPADLIKLDGLFVRDLPDNPSHQAMVSATVLIARSLGAQLCAEFVDDPRTVDLLTAEGVDYLQGYHIARPCPVESLAAGWAGAKGNNQSPAG